MVVAALRFAFMPEHCFERPIQRLGSSAEVVMTSDVQARIHALPAFPRDLLHLCNASSNAIEYGVYDRIIGVLRLHQKVELNNQSNLTALSTCNRSGRNFVFVICEECFLLH